MKSAILFCNLKGENKMKRSSFIRIIAMALVLCMLFTSCKKPEPDPVVDPVAQGCQHTTTQLKNAVPATCTTPGYTGDKVCTECGETVEKGAPITTLAHNTKLRNTKAATCTAEGYSGDEVCKSCGTIVTKGSTIPVREHVEDEGMTTKVPTCIATGTKTYSCIGCGLVMRTETLPQTSHDDRYHDMLDGTHNHTCTECTLTENEQHVPTDEGTYVPASCEEPAYTKYTCSVCKGVYKVYEEGSEAAGHDYSEWEVLSEPDCKNDGYKYHECTVCGKSETIKIDKTPDVHNHVFSHYQGDAPTCAEGAVEVHVCTVCGDASVTKDVPATGAHNYVDLENTGDGWIRKQCSVCEKVVSNFDASQFKEADVKAEAIPEDVPFEVTTQNAAIEFPTDVIGQLKGGEDVKIGADILTDEAKDTAIHNATNLTPEEKKRLENVELYDFNVTIDGAALSGNFNAAVSVTIPYQLKTFTDDDGNEYTEDKDGIVIWYVGTDGSITKITDVQYNEETETVTFLAPHFSMYAVAYEETQEMRCRRGNHDYEVVAKVEATCSTYGFSTLQCTCCHRVTIDYVVEKLHHTYGELIPANPTCASGDYDHKICTACGDVLNIKYYRELGHQLDKAATCTEGSFCSRCNEVAVAPLGHAWSEWKTVVQAGALTTGLRVRYCLRCGYMQESETASTGDITAIEFDSYEELLEIIYDLVVSVDKASVEFVLTTDYGVMTVIGYVDRSGDDLLVKVDAHIGEEELFSAFYKNGVTLMEYIGEMGTVTLDDMMAVSIDVAAAYLQAYYDLLDPYCSMGLDTIREYLTVYADILGEDVNNILANAQLDYTVDDIFALLDSIETVYAYASLKLGYTTGAEIKDGVAIPTKADFVSILKAFMEKTEEGKNTTYTANTETIAAELATVLEGLQALCEKTLSEVIFEQLGDQLTQLDPSITSTQALANYVKAKLPGTLKVNEALSVIEGMLGKFSDMTLEDVYALANQVMAATYGEEVDVEAMISEYYNFTLNELVAGMTGEDITAEQFYDAILMLDEMTVGDVPAGEAPLGQYVAYAMYMLSELPCEGVFSFTVDPYGRLVSLTVDGTYTMEYGTENGTEINVYDVTVNINRDSSIKLTIPEKFLPIDVTIQGGLDAEGNYVITGVPEGTEIDLKLYGQYYTGLDNVLEYNAAASQSAGFPIYTLPEHLWTRHEHVVTLIQIGNKYYNYTVHETRGEYPDFDKYIAEVDLFEFLSDPTCVLPDESSVPVATYDGMPVYASPIGYLVQIGGEWWVCDAYLYYSYEKDHTGNREVYYGLEHIHPMYSFNEKFVDSTVELSSVEDYYYDMDYWYDGANLNVRVDLFIDGWGNQEFRGVSDTDGVRLVYVPEGHVEEMYEQVYVIGSQAYLGSYKYDDSNDYTSKIVMQRNGVKSETTATFVELFNYVPEYYLKIADGSYIVLNTYYYIEGIIGGSNTVGGNIVGGTITDKFESMFYSYYIVTDLDVSGLPTKQLSDGNTMYVVGYAPGYICNYDFGEVTYGYVQVFENGFIRAYCVEQDGYMVAVEYQGAQHNITLYYDDIRNLDEHTTFENGTVTISKELVSQLMDTCTLPGYYIGVMLNGTKTVGKDVYHFLHRGFIKFNMDEIVLGGAHSGEAMKDPFYELFQGIGNGGSGYTELNTYIDENGNLVLEGAHMLGAYVGFEDYFPAEPFLKYDSVESENADLPIYSYTYYGDFGRSYIYKNGKYYNYDRWDNYSIETMTLSGILSSWRIEDIRYEFDIYPDAETPEELHNKRVYSIYLTFLPDSYKYSSLVDEQMARIELYGFVHDGKLQILTGWDAKGESLVQFEGYMPIDEYIASLSASIVNDEYIEDYNYNVYINGVWTVIYTDRIELSEQDSDVTYYLELKRVGDNKYIYSSYYLSDYVTFGDVVQIPDYYTLESVNQWTTYNAVYDVANFTWVETYKYYAVKIGDIYYDYNDYCNNWYDQISDIQQFKDQLYGTDRVYRVLDNEIGEYRYYNKFVPGTYFRGEDEIFGFVLPDNYRENWLGNTENGNGLYEIVYYVDETMDPEIDVITLSDGLTFYHINGIGYVQLDENLYVKAVMAYDENGEAYAMCLYRRAFVEQEVLNHYGKFKEYISWSSNSVVIPRKLLEYMKDMPDWCYFTISTSQGEIRFDCYILEAYFNGEISGGGDGDGDYNDKYDKYGK